MIRSLIPRLPHSRTRALKLCRCIFTFRSGDPGNEAFVCTAFTYRNLIPRPGSLIPRPAVSFPDCNVIHSLVPRPGNETMHYSLCPKVPAVLIGYIEKVRWASYWLSAVHRLVEKPCCFQVPWVCCSLWWLLLHSSWLSVWRKEEAEQWGTLWSSSSVSLSSTLRMDMGECS